jgi:hypothetical protein
MNKLINLILIFLVLRYLAPYTFSSFELLHQNPGYYNLFAGFFISIIQFSYNLYMKYTNKKEMTLKNNALNSLFKGLIVVASYYIFADIKDRYKINSELNEETIKAGFVTTLLLVFILTKCLISP